MERFQYGMQVTFQVENVLMDLKTSKSHVKYVKTKYHGDMLLMDNEVQFSTLDEEIYHDLLLPRDRCFGKSVLILGGGDGLALRNIYRYSPDVERVVLVDYDQEFVESFAKGYPRNQGSLVDPRTRLVYMDAFQFIYAVNEKYDTIIIDLPDPDSNDMQDLYFKIIRSIPKIMTPDAVVTCHVGPISLCKEHPNWVFITNFMNEVQDYEPELRSKYIPSFSHEWGVVEFKNKVW